MHSRVSAVVRGTVPVRLRRLVKQLLPTPPVESPCQQCKSRRRIYGGRLSERRTGAQYDNVIFSPVVRACQLEVSSRRTDSSGLPLGHDG